jgi:hypothetical protein
MTVHRDARGHERSHESSTTLHELRCQCLSVNGGCYEFALDMPRKPPTCAPVVPDNVMDPHCDARDHERWHESSTTPHELSSHTASALLASATCLPWTCLANYPPFFRPDNVMDPHAAEQYSKTKFQQYQTRKRAHGHGKRVPTSAEHARTPTGTAQSSDAGSDCHHLEHHTERDIEDSDGRSPADFGVLLHDASGLVGTTHIRHNTLMAVLTEKLPVTAMHHSETVRYNNVWQACFRLDSTGKFYQC